MRVTVVAWAEGNGGAERYLSSLYSALAGRGVQASLVGSLPDAGPFTDVRPVQLARKWSRKAALRSALGAAWERRRFLQAVKALPGPDVYHLQYKREQILLTRALACRAPVVWTEHGPLPDGTLARGLRWAYRVASRHVSMIVCVSATTEHSVRAVTRSPRVIRIDNAVDPSHYAPPTPTQQREARSQLGLSDAPVMLWAGQLHDGKLPKLALNTMRGWAGTSVMLGDGPLASELQAEAERVPDRDIRLKGHVPSTAPWLQAADVLLFTSAGRGEGLPLTLLEARATGVPIVANEGSGVEDFVRAAGGHVVSADAAALAAAAASAVTARRGQVQADEGRSERAWESWLDSHHAVFQKAGA